MEIGTNYRMNIKNLEEEIKILLNKNFKFIRIGTGDFSLITPEGYNFKYFKKLIELFNQNDINFTLPFSLCEFNYPKSFPNVLNNLEYFLTDQNGTHIFQQDFRNFNFNHPEIRDKFVKFFNAFFDFVTSFCNFKNKKKIIFNIGNELTYFGPTSIIKKKACIHEKYNYSIEKKHHAFTRLRNYFLPEYGVVGEFDKSFHLTDYSRFTIAKFQNWLKNRYKELKKLNKTWTSSYTSFEEIVPPTSNYLFENEKILWIEWLSFRFYDFTEFFKWIYNCKRENIALTHNLIPARNVLANPLTAINYWNIGKYLDVIGIDYPDIFDFYVLSVLEKPIIIEEASIGYIEDYMFRETILSAAGGADYIAYWRPDIKYLEERKEQFKGVIKAKPFTTKINGKLKKSKIAIVYSHLSALAYLYLNNRKYEERFEKKENNRIRNAKEFYYLSEYSRKYQVPNYLGKILSLWMTLMELNYPTQIVSEEFIVNGRINEYEVIILPYMISLTEEIINKLCNYKGIIIGMGKYWGMYDELLNETGNKFLNKLFACDRSRTEEKENEIIQFFDIKIKLNDFSYLKASNKSKIIASSLEGNAVGIKTKNRIFLSTDFFSPVDFLYYDGVPREVLDFGLFQKVISEKQIKIFEKILKEVHIKPELNIKDKMPGVWYTILESDNEITIVIFDYKNWYKCWNIMTNENYFKWDGKTIQPKCFTPLNKEYVRFFRPKKKKLNVCYNLPKKRKIKEIVIYYDKNKALIKKEISVKNIKDGILKIPINDMEFVSIIKVFLS